MNTQIVVALLLEPPKIPKNAIYTLKLKNRAALVVLVDVGQSLIELGDMINHELQKNVEAEIEGFCFTELTFSTCLVHF